MSNRERHITQRPYEPGCVIGGRYRIAGLIGRGGMGEVYAVEDLRLQGKLRALKVNKPPTEDGLYGADEASLLMRLSHPRLPLIVDYFPPDDSGSEMLVTDYIDGQTLHSYLAARDGALQAAEALEAGIQLCDALHYLHMQQPPVIHRDLKPTNVMIDRAGFVRLIDFGIARSFKTGQAQDTVKLGTPGFAAPEQAGERQSDARTDVYGLGALLYYLLSGGERSVSGGFHSEGLPAKLLPRTASVISRMLEASPAARFTSMAEAEQALASCLELEREAAEAQGNPGFVGTRYVSGGRHGRLPTPFTEKSNGALMPAASKQQHITVASLSPGAGATFVAITLARLIAMTGVPCAAVEHPAHEPEWQALLDFAGKRQQAAGDYGPLDPRYARMNDGGVLWHGLHPSQETSGADDLAKFRLMTDALRQSVIVTDISSRWPEEPQERLLEADHLLFVADPFPAKWTPTRVRKAQTLSYDRGREGKSTSWIANKDCRFRRRQDWLALLPAKPAAAIPLLPADKWLDKSWRGRWATDDPAWLKTFQGEFRRLIGSLFAST